MLKNNGNPPFYETLATWIKHNSTEFNCNEWNRLLIILFSVIKILGIEKFLKDLPLIVQVIWNIFTSYINIPYKAVPYEKTCRGYFESVAYLIRHVALLVHRVTKCTVCTFKLPTVSQYNFLQERSPIAANKSA